jgi:hypothetical protein
MDTRAANRRRQRFAQLSVATGPGLVTNPYPVYIDLYLVDSTAPSAAPVYQGAVLPLNTQTVTAYFDATGSSVEVTGSYSGGYTIVTAAPNSIPLPAITVPVPQDSAPVLVGAAMTSNNYVVTREQYWARSSESYSLAPNEVRTVSVIQTSGVTKSSTSLKQLSSSLSTNVQGGWGPISAGISASLNSNSTEQHQVTLTEQTTNSMTVQLTSGDNPVLVIYWQLMERIIWWTVAAQSNMAAVTLEEDEWGYALAPNTLEAKASVLVGQLPLVPVVSPIIS